MRFSAFCNIRFVEVSSSYKELVDWGNTFPNGDNLLNSSSNYQATYPAYYSPVFLRNSVKFQFQSSTPYDLTPGDSDVEITAFDLYDDAYSFGYTITNITPASWASGFGYEQYIYEVDITPTSSYTGEVQFRITDGSEYWISEPIRILESAKGYVKIEYSNSENDFAMLFNDNGTEYSYKLFFDADFITSSGGSKSVYDDDRGSQTILRSTPQRIIEVYSPFLPAYLVEKIDLLMNCDSVKFNDILVSSEEGLNKEELSSYYNGFSGSMTLIVQDWDYRDQQTVKNIQVITDSDNDVMIDDNDNVITN